MGLKKIALDSSLTPIAWAWEGLIPKGYVSLVGALPGEGKSVLLTALAWQTTRTPGSLLDRSVAGGGTVYVDFDAATGDGRAVRGWFERHRAAYPDGNMEGIVLFEPDADTFGLGSEEVEELKATVRESGAGLVVIDSFMAAFPVDPAKLREVQAPMWHLRNLAAETGAAVVVIDHLPKPMAGEKAGARGVIGSIAKPAQARAVHLLTRVPPKEVEGRHVLRWENTKNSFFRLAEPFGVELGISAERVVLQSCELPEGYGDTKLDRAARNIIELLQTNVGMVVNRQSLLKAAIEGANVSEKTAKQALDTVVARVGVEKVELGGRGNQMGYRLPLDHEAFPKSVPVLVPNYPKSNSRIQNGVDLGYTPLPPDLSVTPNGEGTWEVEV